MSHDKHEYVGIEYDICPLCGRLGKLFVYATLEDSGVTGYGRACSDCIIFRSTPERQLVKLLKQISS